MRSSNGVVFKRCGCRDDGQQRLEQHCPRLTERGHGSWYFHCSATNLLGRRERARRGGYPSQAAARRARDDVAGRHRGRPHRPAAGRWSGGCGTGWTPAPICGPTTRCHYTRDVEQVLVPHLGRLPAGRPRRAACCGRCSPQIAATPTARAGRSPPSALQHLRTTLRAALNLAVREGVLDCNPARHIEISGYRRPHAQVWTDDRVEQWEQTGERPAVAVWTAEHLATFLGAVTDDSLFAFWWLTALRGLRRGELCGLRWIDVDLDRGCSSSNATAPPPATRSSKATRRPPAGRRAVALDKHTVQVLRAHRRRQLDHRDRGRRATGKTWTDTGYVFTRADGEPINPNYATTRFRQTRPTAPAYRRSGCTTCATAPRPSPTRPAPT